MTTMMPKESKCSVCGAVNTFTVIASTNTFGSPDLDLRPPEMQRSTMPEWIQKCPECGYISADIEDESSITIEMLKSDDYITCDGIRFKSDLAKDFYRYYKINSYDQNKEDACFALLHAAWACDDAGDDDNAVFCRKQAIPLMEQLIAEGHDDKENLKLMRADLMRRSGMFDEMIAEYSRESFDQEIMNRVLQFQIKKAKEEDTRCYLVSEAAEEAED